MERVRDARLPAARKSPRHASVIEPAERARMRAGLDVPRRGSVEPGSGGRTAGVELRAAVKRRAAAVEMVAIDERATVRDIGVVVVDDRPAAPVGVPVVPSPTEPREEPDPETGSERDSRADGVEPGECNPARIDGERWAIHAPRVVGWHVDDLRVCRLDHDGLALRRNGLLGRRLEVPRLLRALAHRLDRVEHGLLLVHIGVAQRRCPGKVLVHACQDRGKLRERLHARIPGHLIDRLGQWFPLQIRVLLHPAVGFDDLGRVRGSREDLRNQSVRIQGDGRHQLLQLLGRLLEDRLSFHRARRLRRCRGVRAREEAHDGQRPKQ